MVFFIKGKMFSVVAPSTESVEVKDTKNDTMMATSGSIPSSQSLEETATSNTVVMETNSSTANSQGNASDQNVVSYLSVYYLKYEMF